jgi:4-alpha-glucanotransferase
MTLPRGSGVLLHPTSLQGPFGSGDLGSDATRFLDWLVEAGQTYWQMLPLTPPGFGASPYAGLSAFAMNEALVSPTALAEHGWLSPAELDETRPPFASHIDFETSAAERRRLLGRAAERFFASHGGREAFDAFCATEAFWLEDFTLFMALNEAHEGRPWTTWDGDVRDRWSDALERVRRELAPAVRRHAFAQWQAFEQWHALHDAAKERGIRLVGDIPIFVSHHSADVWANPHLFQLDPHGEPTHVAGVPPDYFSETGQRWGNPLYRWDLMAQDGFAWWVERFRSLLTQFDVVRLDHFRGFESYWEIPAAEPTAIKGRWVPGPGAALFEAVERALGRLPLIAEDLGIITPQVTQLRERFGLPGMKVLQFAFGGEPDHPFLPHTYETNAVVYTGTHDNDTSLGWYRAAPERERHELRSYLSTDASDVAWDLIRAAERSRADVCLVPMQDVLRLGSEARMNTPGVAAGNWAWRFDWSEVPHDAAQRLAEVTRGAGR